MNYPTQESQQHPTKGWKSTSQTCRNCGKPFLGWFCHKNCPNCTKNERRRKPPKECVCESCHKPYKKAGRRRKFCDTCSRDRKLQKAPPRDCKECGRSFRPNWHRADAELCSRKCQGLWINAEGLGPRRDDAELWKHLTDKASSVPPSVTDEEFLNLARVTRKVLRARGWTVSGLFEATGVQRTRPVLASRFEERVHHVLRAMFPESKIETQKKFQWLLGGLGGFLSFDFYVEDQNLLVEADGKQHLSSRGGMYPTEKIQAHDETKTRFAKESGIRLARVSQTLSESKIRQQILDSIAVIQPEKNEENALNELSDSQCVSARNQASMTLKDHRHPCGESECGRLSFLRSPGERPACNPGRDRAWCEGGM